MLRVDHDCEVNTQQDEIIFFPGRGPVRKMLDFIRRSIMASHKNAGARKYCRSHAAILYEKRRHLRHYITIIHPFSIFRSWWDIMMVFVITVCLVLFPYQASFNITENKPIFWILTKNILNALCICDIIVNFLTGYYDTTQRLVQMEESLIIRHYVQYGTFLPDLLGSLPTDLFFVTKWDELIVAREIASMIFIFRTFTIYTYIERIVNAYDTSQTLYEFCSMLFWVMLAIHWQACIYWVVPIAAVSLYSPERPKKDSWINEADLWGKDKGSQYFHSILRVVVTFTRSGFMRTEPSTAEDQYLVVIFQILGTLAFCILIVRFMQYLQGVYSSKLKYQSATAQLRQYMRHKQLSPSTQRRFIQYYEFRFQHRYFWEAEILNTLSTQMRQEIGMHSCRKLVENVTFFNNLPLSLLARIVALLRSEIFLTNDVIVRANQPGDCMYFIATGTVAVYTHSGKEVCHLDDGAHFGEIALVMPDEKRVASVVAVEVCELYRLERADFARTIHPYPMLWERIKKIALERHEKTTILNAQ